MTTAAPSERKTAPRRASMAWLQRSDGARLGVLVFFLLAVGAGVAFGLAALDGERRRDTQLAAILRPEYAGDDRLAPDFSLRDRNGRTYRLSAYRGKTVVLHFWSRDCPPCVQEMAESIPAFDEIVRERSDVVFLMVSVDPGWDAVSALVPPGVRAPLLFDPERRVVTAKYGTRLFPETWIIDPDGVIRARFDRTLDWASPVFTQYVTSFR